MNRVGVAAFALAILAIACEPATEPGEEGLRPVDQLRLDAQEAFDPSGGVGDAIIRSVVFVGDKKGRTTGEDGINDIFTGEILSNSLAEWRGGDGDHVGEVVHVGRGCFGDLYLADPAGKIALIQRGACAFSTKIGLAQLAGATGVIVYNNSTGGENLVQMAAFPGTFPPGAEEITIPVAFVTYSDGVALAAAPVEAKMEGASFEVLEETVEYIAESDGLPKEAARSLKSKVKDARRAARSGDFDTALETMLAFQTEVINLVFIDMVLSFEDGGTLFFGAESIIVSLLEEAGLEAS